MIMRRTIFCSLFFAALSCKQDENALLGLDNLAGRESAPPQCSSSKLTHGWDIQEIGYEGESKALLAQQVLSAAPPLVGELFKALKGRVIITPKPFDYCPGFSGEDARFANGFVCWHYERATSASAIKDQTSLSSSYNEPPRPIIAVKGEVNEMSQGLLRALGYLFITRFIELDVAGNSVTTRPLRDQQFEAIWNNLAVAVFDEVGLVSTDNSLFRAVLPPGFIALERGDQLQRLRNDDSLRWAKQSFFAEAFDSYYCSDATRKKMKQDYSRSHQAFLPFAERLAVTESEQFALTTNFDFMQVLTMLLSMLTNGDQMMPDLQGLGINPEGNGGLIQPPASNPTNPNQDITPINPQPSNPGGAQNSTTAEVIRLSNEHRQSVGRSPLQEDPELTAACLEHAQWMEKTGRMDHYNKRPDYPGPRNVAENIARGQQTPAAVVRAWIDSPGHRANLENGGYTRIGAAESGKWWCQQFR